MAQFTAGHDFSDAGGVESPLTPAATAAFYALQQAMAEYLNKYGSDMPGLPGFTPGAISDNEVQIWEGIYADALVRGTAPPMSDATATSPSEGIGAYSPQDLAANPSAFQSWIDAANRVISVSVPSKHSPWLWVALAAGVAILLKVA